MHRREVLEQYKKINSQQKFEQVDVDKEKYLENIIKFIDEAKKNLPTELEGIITKSSFDVFPGKKYLGSLRLQPKILKLTKIDVSELPKLKSRGIKS